MTSYCSECDAPNGCTHNAARYLNPVHYTPILKDGKRVGWNIDDTERDRWDKPPRIAAPAPPTEEPKPLTHIVADLEDWVYLDLALEHTLRQQHDRNPLAVTRLVDKLITDIRAGQVTTPAGALTYRLRQIPATA